MRVEIPKIDEYQKENVAQNENQLFLSHMESAKKSLDGEIDALAFACQQNSANNVALEKRYYAVRYADFEYDKVDK